MKKYLLLTLFLLGLGGGAFYLLGMQFPAPPELGGTLRQDSLTWDDLARDYAIYEPAELTGNPALVLVMHGSMGNPQQARSAYAYAFDQLADEHGFLVIYPHGFEDHFNGCRRQGPYSAKQQQIDDVGFLRALVARLVVQYDANPGAVFATGISNGGQMALRLALEAPDLVTAVAPVAASLPTTANMDCVASGEPAAVLLMNGTDDPMNPYAGGTVALYGLVGNRGEVLSSQATIQYWAQLAGHTDSPQQRTLADTVSEDNSTIEVLSWVAPGRKPVELYSVIGGGHNVPHPQLRLPRLLGGTNNDIVAAQEMWRFFTLARDITQ
jgi:polyhydroxybutyrate depolymerase